MQVDATPVFPRRQSICKLVNIWIVPRGLCVWCLYCFTFQENVRSWVFGFWSCIHSLIYSFKTVFSWRCIALEIVFFSSGTSSNLESFQQFHKSVTNCTFQHETTSCCVVSSSTHFHFFPCLWAHKLICKLPQQSKEIVCQSDKCCFLKSRLIVLKAENLCYQKNLWYFTVNQDVTR